MEEVFVCPMCAGTWVVGPGGFLKPKGEVMGRWAPDMADAMAKGCPSCQEHIIPLGYHPWSWLGAEAGRKKAAFG